MGVDALGASDRAAFKLGTGTLRIIRVNQAIARSANWQSSLDALNQLEVTLLQPTVVTFNSLIKVFAGRWRETVQCLREMRMRRVVSDEITCNTCIGVLSKAHWRKAQALADRLPEAFGVCALLAESGNWRVAMGVMTRCDADTACFNALIPLSTWAFALKMLQKMPAQRVQPNRRSWNALSAQLAPPQWPRSLAQLSRMDLVGLNSLMSLCEKASAWKTCLQLLVSRIRIADKLSFNCAILGLGQSAWRRGLLLVEDMMWRRVQPDSASYLGLCHRDNLELLPKHMAAHQVSPSAALRGALVAACQEEGDWRQALRLVVAGVPDAAACGAALAAGQKAQRWKEALALLRFQRRRRIALDALGLSAALAAPKRAKWRQALALLRVGLASLVSPAIAGYAAAVQCLGRWRRAVQLLVHVFGQYT
ncbi:unnamed protein product [Effrenium voratum]|uniref:Pentatricopeptide repeat-containing protein, chloroplastic n=1 Tax=Effrenium voratum TaxID=2562239 RepID=A0AA36JQI8_9DINO|nr:unnamed protein product [Effrenium voratum]